MIPRRASWNEIGGFERLRQNLQREPYEEDRVGFGAPLEEGGQCAAVTEPPVQDSAAMGECSLPRGASARVGRCHLGRRRRVGAEPRGRPGRTARGRCKSLQ